MPKRGVFYRENNVKAFLVHYVIYKYIVRETNRKVSWRTVIGFPLARRYPGRFFPYNLFAES